MEKIRLLLVDDQALFVESLRMVLETRAKDFDVIGVAHDGREAVEIARQEQPDVILMDVRMPGMNGVESMRLTRMASPRTRVLMLTTFDDDEYVVQALQIGAAGYLLKDMPPVELIAAVRAVNKGSILMSPKVAAKLVGKLVIPPEDKETARASVSAPLWFKELSGREREILHLVAKRLDNREIAEHLYIAEQTVKNHVSLIYSKMGARDRVQASLMALEAGLGEPDSSTL